VQRNIELVQPKRRYRRSLFSKPSQACCLTNEDSIMNKNIWKVSSALAAGMVIAALYTPAHAQVSAGASVGGGGVSAGASIGGSGGANAGASIGGGSSGGIDADADVSIGGGSGANAAVSAAIGGTDGVDADATASIGGTGGVNADVGVGLGDGAAADVGVGIGGAAAPAVTGAPGTGGATNGLTGVVANMSPGQLARTKKQCRQVMSDRSSFDSSLVALCSLVQSASR
jgi:hypothetical protein